MCSSVSQQSSSNMVDTNSSGFPFAVHFHRPLGLQPLFNCLLLLSVLLSFSSVVISLVVSPIVISLVVVVSLQ